MSDFLLSRQRMFASASAVCSFTEKRIADAFAGNYKKQESDDKIFNVVATSREPSTRPSEVGEYHIIRLAVYLPRCESARRANNISC